MATKLENEVTQDKKELADLNKMLSLSKTSVNSAADASKHAQEQLKKTNKVHNETLAVLKELQKAIAVKKIKLAALEENLKQAGIRKVSANVPISGRGKSQGEVHGGIQGGISDSIAPILTNCTNVSVVMTGMNQDCDYGMPNGQFITRASTKQNRKRLFEED